MSDDRNGFRSILLFGTFVIATLAIGWLPWYAWGETTHLFFVPFVAGLGAVLLFEGRRGLVEQLKSFIRVRSDALTWLIVLLLPGVVTVAALLYHSLRGGQLPESSIFTAGAASSLPVLLVSFFLPVGSDNLGELCFRGIGYSRLKRLGTWIAPAVVGASMALFLLPEFFASRSPQAAMGGLAYFPYFLLVEIGWSYPMWWVFQRSNGSALLAGYLFHSSFNFWTVVLLVPTAWMSGADRVSSFDSLLFRRYAILVALVGIVFALLNRKRAS